MSGLTMYYFTYTITKKRSIALFSAIFYLIAPYKLANVYKRYAIGEFTAMVFMPLVFLGVYNLFEQDKKKHYFIAIGAIGLMLSHTVTTIYTAMFCFIYILFNIKKLKQKDILIKCIINVFFILLLSAMFWLPLIEASTKAEYVIFNDKIMKTNGQYAYEHTIHFSQLIRDIGEEDGTTFVLGLPTILCIILTPFVIKKVDNRYKSFYLIYIIFSLVSCFMFSMFFPWVIMPGFICKLQYPWRMVGFLNYFISLVCGINIYVVIKEYIKKDLLKTILIAVFVGLSIISSLKIQSQFFVTDNTKDLEYEKYILDDRKISHLSINRDYMPVKAIALQNTYVKERKDITYILAGDVQVVEESKENLTDIIKIKNAKKESSLEFPYYYYPGYEVTLKTENKELKLEDIESQNGYLSCIIPEDFENATIYVTYKGTFITYFAYALSFVGLIIFITYIFLYKRNKIVY